MGRKSAAAKTRRTVTAAGKFEPTPHLQVGALCYRRTRKGIRILLITSRDTRRWVVPKGWPMRKRSESSAAAREAFEEAGIRGTIFERSIGVFTYAKRMVKGPPIPCLVRVYALKVQEELKRYPELGQRRNKWFSQKNAARKVAEKDLAALIRTFEPPGGP